MPEYSWNVIVETFRINDITQGYQEAPEILWFNDEIRYFWSNSDYNTGRLEWRYSDFDLETQELQESNSLDVDGVLSSGFGSQGQFEAAFTQDHELLTVWAAFSYSGRSVTVSKVNSVINDISSSVLAKPEDEQFGPTVDLLVTNDNAAYFTYFTYSEDNGTELKIGEIDANTGDFISSGVTVSSLGNSGFPVELLSLEQNGSLSFLYAAPDDSERGIFLTRYDPITNEVVSNIRVNQDTFLDQVQPRYAELSSGATIISWRSFGEAGFPENGLIKAQMIDPAGGVIGENFTLISDERVINGVDSYEIFNLSEDKFGVAAIVGSRIFLEIFDYQGNSISAFDDISDGYPSFISDLSAIVVEESKIVLAWSAENRDGSNFGVFSQVIELEQNVADQITNGTPASESLNGNAGNDTLYGESGNDGTILNFVP